MNRTLYKTGAVMVVDFGAKNFFSFKEGFNISFQFGKNCPEHISNGEEISNLICIKGANGSGKTNVLKAIYFIADFISNSFDNKPNGYLNFDSYFLNEGDSEFYVSFVLKNIAYRYEFVLNEKEVIKEVLYRKDKREVKVFERKDNKLVYAIKDFSGLYDIPKLRKNVSVISMANQFEISSIEPIHTFFRRFISNVRYSGMLSETIELSDLNEFLHGHKEYLDFVVKMVSKFDPAIVDIFLRETEDETKNKSYTPWFVFNVNGEVKVLQFALQSSGTKSLYKQLASYKAVLDSGSFLILDEFDINLHPHILPHLLDIFIDKELNKKGAQLIFTTHNTEVLDLLGRHRTYLVNKEGTESYCYRLDEIPGDILRNDRPISPAYNQGKIGGVPTL
ncbi:TPA: AAA family ATPase [Serratia fonticola]